MMARRLIGSLMFLGIATFLFEIAGRLALEQRAGWGWFVFAGLMVTGVALNLWTGESRTTRCPRCQKPHPANDLEYKRCRTDPSPGGSGRVGSG
jgi:hypothetical protein